MKFEKLPEGSETVISKRQIAHDIIDQLSPENLDIALLALQIPGNQEIKDRQDGYIVVDD